MISQIHGNTTCVCFTACTNQSVAQKWLDTIICRNAISSYSIVLKRDAAPTIYLSRRRRASLPNLRRKPHGAVKSKCHHRGLLLPRIYAPNISNYSCMYVCFLTRTLLKLNVRDLLWRYLRSRDEKKEKKHAPTTPPPLQTAILENTGSKSTRPPSARRQTGCLAGFESVWCSRD